MDDEPRSLKTVFADAESKRLTLERTPFTPNSTEYADTVSSAIKLYQESLALASAVSLFSPNESLEDLSTTDLPFLLINFHLAEITQKIPSSPSSPRDDRKRILSSARDAYERYLHLLDSYNLLPPPHKKLLEQYTDAPTTFTTGSPTANAEARRNAKIANFKLEKELRTKLDFLRRRPEYGTEDDRRGGTAGAGDEDAVREVHLAHLAYSTHMTFQALEGLNREWEILSLAPPPPQPNGPNHQPNSNIDARDRQRYGGLGDNTTTTTLDQPRNNTNSLLNRGGPLLSKQGKPLQPFTLLPGGGPNRAEMTRNVFRPSHNLPTMTIDEYLDEEARRGGIIEGGGEASGRRPEPDEDNYEKADAETMKARAWDEFVEANPKGSGNTLNRG